MKLSGTIAPALSGHVSGFDLFDVTQLLCLSGRSRILRVSFGDRRGTLVFEQGALTHASTPSAGGQDAFFEIAQWTGGSFESVDAAEAGTFPPNIHVPTMHLLMESARRKDEGEGAPPALPPEEAEEPAEVPAEGALAWDSPAHDRLWDELATIQQEVAEELAAGVAAPVPAREVPSGTSEQAPAPAAAEPVPDGGPPGEEPWWRQVTARWGEAVQVVVAWPPEAGWDQAAAEVRRLAKVAGAKPPADLLSATGPSFVRIYPEAGGILSLVFLGISKRHRFLFETLVRSAHAALVPRECAGSETQHWMGALPATLDWCVVAPDSDGCWGFSDRLRELAGNAS
ncbi:MAG: DUF4388 domain-containing protein [Thermodesulfobacteriota bacterium]